VIRGIYARRALRGFIDTGASKPVSFFVMARRHSRVSNYALGQLVRMAVFGGAGFAVARLVLPRGSFIHAPQQLTLGCWIAAIVMAVFARRYT
jgi:hypothetical protein